MKRMEGKSLRNCGCSNILPLNLKNLLIVEKVNEIDLLIVEKFNIRLE